MQNVQNTLFIFRFLTARNKRQAIAKRFVACITLTNEKEKKYP